MLPPQAAFAVLFSISFCHLLNDMIQALLPAMYPMLKTSFALDFDILVKTLLRRAND